MDLSDEQQLHSISMIYATNKSKFQIVLHRDKVFCWPPAEDKYTAVGFKYKPPENLGGKIVIDVPVSIMNFKDIPLIEQQLGIVASRRLQIWLAFLVFRRLRNGGWRSRWGRWGSSRGRIDFVVAFVWPFTPRLATVGSFFIINMPMEYMRLLVTMERSDYIIWVVITIIITIFAIIW